MNDEQHRHRCEVRDWLKRRTALPAAWLAAALRGVEAKRGKDAADRLRADIAKQWAAGNRGEWGDWR